MKKFLIGVCAGIAGAVLIVVIGAAFFLGLVGSIGTEAPVKVYATVPAIASNASLAEHTKIFEKRIEQPLPGVHVAMGYGLANVILIEAPDGLIMVDTLESVAAAQSLLPYVNQLRNTTGKDITDIIFTHNHADHVFGAGVYLTGQATVPRVWAHEDTEHRVHQVVNVLRPILFKRSMRQFGVFLPEDAFENAGIGPFIAFNETSSMHFLPPTDTVSDSLTVTLAGEEVVFTHAPGETDDQLMIFLPKRKMLLPADNYYHAFPNLYAIRGTPYRNLLDWVGSLDMMLTFNAETMVPQHSMPVIGSAAIQKQLTDYRDAITFVHDQTIRMVNKGYTPDEIVEIVKLPPHLANAPYLQEFYGKVEWAVRSVFSGTLGWFSGDPADLIPVSPTREAELMLRLAGSKEALRTEYNQAMVEGEPTWALSLATHMQRLNIDGAGALRANSLRALGANEISSTGRNYFLTMAAEAEGWQMPISNLNDTPLEMFDDVPINNFMRSLLVTLKAEEVLNVELSYGFNFTDLDTPLTVRIRRGIAVLEPGLAEDRQGTLVATTGTFKRISVKKLQPGVAIASGDLSFEGGPLIFNNFMAHFDTP